MSKRDSWADVGYVACEVDVVENLESHRVLSQLDARNGRNQTHPALVGIGVDHPAGLSTQILDQCVGSFSVYTISSV